jgi:hypothetical protein
MDPTSEPRQKFMLALAGVTEFFELMLHNLKHGLLKRCVVPPPVRFGESLNELNRQMNSRAPG